MHWMGEKFSLQEDMKMEKFAPDGTLIRRI